ncbi:Uncharacterised protein [Mycobacteroides abscessus subsp. abscessus]|nr:Uncharacterised protein [Mycobacteroides abscessus subsp. abscessus]
MIGLVNGQLRPTIADHLAFLPESAGHQLDIGAFGGVPRNGSPGGQRFVIGVCVHQHESSSRHGRVFFHSPAVATIPTGTAPASSTFCTLGPAAAMVVSCMIGSTVAIFHNCGSA